jgi:hypothetical protein
MADGKVTGASDEVFSKPTIVRCFHKVRRREPPWTRSLYRKIGRRSRLSTLFSPDLGHYRMHWQRFDNMIPACLRRLVRKYPRNNRVIKPPAMLLIWAGIAYNPKSQRGPVRVARLNA